MATTTEVLEAKVTSSGVSRFRRAMGSAASALGSVAGSADRADRAINGLPLRKRIAIELAGSQSAVAQASAVDRAVNGIKGRKRISLATSGFGSALAQIAATRTSLTGFGADASSVGLAIRGVSTIITTGLIASLVTLLPLLAPISAGLLAITGAAGAVATAFGAIIGSGLLAFGQSRIGQNEQQLAQVREKIARLEALKGTEQGLTAAQERQLEKLKEQETALKDGTTAVGALKLEFTRLGERLQPIIVQFGRQFVPLIERAFAAIPKLTRSVFDAMGAMGPFKDALRDAGGALMSIIPAVIRFTMNVGRQALPVLRDFASFLVTNVGPAIQRLRAYVVAVGPDLLRLLDTVMRFTGRAISAFAALGAAQLRATNRAIAFVGALGRTAAFQEFIGLLGGIGRSIGRLVGEILRATGASQRLSIGVRDVAGVFGVLNGALRVVHGAIESVRGQVRPLLARFSYLSDVARVVATAIGGALVGSLAALVARAVVVGPVLGAVGTALALLTSPIGLVIGALAGLYAAWQRNLFGIRDVTNRVLATITGFWEQHGRLIVSTVRLMGVQLQGAIRAAIAGYNAIIHGEMGRAHRLFEIAWDNIRIATLNALNLIDRVVGTNLRSIADNWLPHGQRVATLATRAYTTARTVVQTALSAIGTIVRTILEQARAFWDRHGTAIVAAARTAYTAAKNAVQTALSTVISVVSGILTRVQAFWAKHGAAITRAARQAYGAARQAIGQALGVIQQIATRVLGLLGQLWGDLQRAVASAVDAIVPRVQDFGRELGLLDRQGRLTKQAIDILISGILSLFGPVGQAISLAKNLYTAWKTNAFGIRDSTNQVFPTVRRLVTETAAAIGRFWTQHIEPMLPVAERIFSGIARTIEQYLQYVWRDVVQPVLRSIEQLWATHGDHVGEDVRQLMTAVEGAFNRLMDVVLPVVEAFVGAALVFWDNFGDEIVAVAKFAMDTVGSVINTALDIIFTAIDVFTDLLVGDWEGAWNAVAGLVERIAGGIVNYLDKWISGLLGSIGEFIDSVIGFFEDLYNALIGGSIVPEMLTGITDAFTGFVSDVVSAVQTWVADVVRFFTGLKDDAIARATELKDQVVAKFTELKDQAIAKVTELATTVMDYLTGRKGPLGGIADAGKALVEGFANGISNAKDAATGAVGDVVQGVRDKLPGSDAREGPLSDLSATGPAIARLLAEGMGNNVGQVVTAAGRIAGGIATALSNLGESGFNAGRGMMESLRSGIERNVGQVARAAGRVGGTVRGYLPGSDADRGPLSDLSSAGPAIPRMLAEGIARNVDDVERASTRLARAAAPAAGASVGVGVTGTPTPALPLGALGGGSGAGGASTTYNRTRVVVRPGAIQVDGAGDPETIGEETVDALNARLNPQL